MVLSMIHAMVCNAGMTIVSGVCGRTMRGGNQPSKPLNMELSLPLATVHRDSGCAFRSVPRDARTDRQTAPGARGPGAPALDRPTNRARARWTDRARGRHRGGNSTPAAGGSRPRRGVRVVAGAGKFRLRRGPPTVDCRPQSSGPRGRGGGATSAGGHAGPNLEALGAKKSAGISARNPQAFQLPPPGGRQKPAPALAVGNVHACAGV